PTRSKISVSRRSKTCDESGGEDACWLSGSFSDSHGSVIISRCLCLDGASLSRKLSDERDSHLEAGPRSVSFVHSGGELPDSARLRHLPISPQARPETAIRRTAGDGIFHCL